MNHWYKHWCGGHLLGIQLRTEAQTQIFCLKFSVLILSCLLPTHVAFVTLLAVLVPPVSKADAMLLPGIGIPCVN